MFNRPQIKELIELLKSGEYQKPPLAYAYIDKYQDGVVLVATDSFRLVSIDLAGGGLDDSEWAALVGKSLSIADLERWYKLADRKDIFEVMDVVKLAADHDINYPEWQLILKSIDSPADTSHIRFNARYAIELERLAGEPLNYYLAGPLSPMRATTRNGLYLLMPLKW